MMLKSMCAAIALIVLVGVTSATDRAQTSANEAVTKLIGYARWNEEGVFVWGVGGYNVSQKKWLNDSAARAAFYPGSKFKLFKLQERKGEITIDRPQSSEVGEGYFAMGRQKLDGEGMAIAVANVAQPMPRAPHEQSLSSEVYRQAAARVLRSQGLSLQQARLHQHWRIDLNSDGVEEVLLSAKSRDEMGAMPRAEKGDYSLAAIRFYDSSRPADKVQTVSLGMDVVKKRIEFGAPFGFDILGCVDVNGDGAMEIVVRNFYYEGEGIVVFAFDGHRVRSVLSAGWGV